MCKLNFLKDRIEYLKQKNDTLDGLTFVDLKSLSEEFRARCCGGCVYKTTKGALHLQAFYSIFFSFFVSD